MLLGVAWRRCALLLGAAGAALASELPHGSGIVPQSSTRSVRFNRIETSKARRVSPISWNASRLRNLRRRRTPRGFPSASNGAAHRNGQP